MQGKMLIKKTICVRAKKIHTPSGGQKKDLCNIKISPPPHHFSTGWPLCTSIPKWIFAPILRGFAESAILGILSPILYHRLQVHQPHGLGTLSHVVCHMWCRWPSSPCTKTLIFPLKKLLDMACATGAWMDIGALYPVLSHDDHLFGPLKYKHQHFHNFSSNGISQTRLN